MHVIESEISRAGGRKQKVEEIKKKKKTTVKEEL